MNKIVNFPYNFGAIARLDSDNIVHNHIYNQCPIGRVDDNNFIYDNNNNVDGFIIKGNTVVGRIDGDNPLLAGAAYLLLIYGNR